MESPKLEGIEPIKLEGFDSIHVINLAHRKDRMELFEKNHPYLKGLYQRFDAINGRTLDLTTDIQYLFRNNLFGWKKSIMGCALSHYRLWQKIASGQLGERVLILEDDVYFNADFIEKWNKMVEHIPAGSDLLFLGGLLPTNIWVLPKVTEPVNDSFAKIAKNSLFGGSPKRYCHFCAYSYILTTAGAMKLCDKISNTGITMPIDNYMLNYDERTFSLYFSTPFLSKSTQFTDINYINGNYDSNDIQAYDSDIMNNTLRFNNQEIADAKAKKIAFIDSIQVINLSHRPDKMETFAKNHPFLEGKYERFDAIYGTNLEMTDEIVFLFRNNHHNWRKNIIGHGLSHYRIWQKIVNGDLGENVLILEDDVVIDKNFIFRWPTIVGEIPSDYDIIMFGPSNVTPIVGSSILPLGKNNMNKGFSTNSYIISRSTAKKLCDCIGHIGIALSMDNYLRYFTDVYLQIFTVFPVLSKSIRGTNDELMNKEVFNSTDILMPYIPIICFDGLGSESMPEKMWLEELFGRKFLWYKTGEPINYEGMTNIILLYRQSVKPTVIENWIKGHPGHNLFLLHLDDRMCTKSVNIYNNPALTKVFRNYWRPEVVGPKVVHLPIGYKTKINREIKPLNERGLAWSFVGSVNRPLRKSILINIGKSGLWCKILMTDTQKIPEEDYVNILLNSKIVPCLPSNNSECSRFYEALEAGAVPIIHYDEKDSYANILNGMGETPLLGCADVFWHNIYILAEQPEFMEVLSDDMKKWWPEYKNYLKNLVQGIMFPN